MSPLRPLAGKSYPSLQVERPRLKGAVLLNVRMVAEPRAFLSGWLPLGDRAVNGGQCFRCLGKASWQTPFGCYSTVRLWGYLLGPSWLEKRSVRALGSQETSDFASLRI